MALVLKLMRLKTIYIFINDILIINNKYIYIFIAVINFATPDGEQSPRSKHSSKS
jgi:hypothetical protein